MKIGLIGNPNVGKSTIFNALTGMHQHTGNWPGKTVSRATGYRVYKSVKYEIEDLPGTYSLMSHSKEEEVTRDYVYLEKYDALVVICDGCSLERNLNLVLQILEVTNRVVMCVNLMDEVKKKKIGIDFEILKEELGIPVIPCTARSNKGVCSILDAVNTEFKNDIIKIDYDFLNDELDKFKYLNTSISYRVIGMRALTEGRKFLNNFSIDKDKLDNTAEEIKNRLNQRGIKDGDIESIISESISLKSEDICKRAIHFNNPNYDRKDRIIDRIITSKITGNLIMLCILFTILWITISGANYPSNFLYNLFFRFEKHILSFLMLTHVPNIFIDVTVYGVYRVLAWVVAVMLPPILIFFPMFAILEDLGYLPRVAFSLDHIYQRCGSCGKGALTMVEGFGCNAVGVTGARIIDSPRERLIAILTNSFIPCNGRFPLLISIISMFIISNSILSSLILTLFVLIGVMFTFLISKLLSKTVLKGTVSSFTLELPPYRRPQILRTIVKSISSKSLSILKRAIAISAPAGLIIWVLANVNVNDTSILNLCASFLDPFAKTIGLDGVILMAFLLALPANEIVIPIMIMGYMSLGYITDMKNIGELKTLFIDNGWTIKTAICVIIFSLMHFPCMTTLLTIKKETGSFKYTFLAFTIPLICGIIVCFLINLI